jgi:predicted membrane channel-forming protein YqfA (hemolysin III family)
MRQIARWIPASLVLIVAAAMLVHGPIPQFAGYHDFADRRAWLGIPNAADVLSNAGFALVGLWGTWALRGEPHRYRLFLWALLLTAFGSAFYHLAPDNDRLVWDRLPIALACAGILAAVHAETHSAPQSRLVAWGLAIAAIGSVLWWSLTERSGAGDLRPYLLIQGAPLVLVPLWQALHGSPRADRIAFGAAILLYVVAKAAELSDGAMLDVLGFASGHTLKHLLAAAASAVIVARVVQRARPVGRV